MHIFDVTTVTLGKERGGAEGDLAAGDAHAPVREGGGRGPQQSVLQDWTTRLVIEKIAGASFIKIV